MNGTGLLGAAASLITTDGCTMTVEFENGERMVVDASAVAAPADVKANLVAALTRNTTDTTVTVTITNDESGESMEYTIVISEAE